MAPLCSTPGVSTCDSNSLLSGRSDMISQQLNDIDGCQDWLSLDRIIVEASYGNLIAEGSLVNVKATVHAYSDGKNDVADFYYATDAKNPKWILFSSVTPSGGGIQTVNAQYTLQSGALQAVRVNYRSNDGTPGRRLFRGETMKLIASPCEINKLGDQDDLFFAVLPKSLGFSWMRQHV